MIGRAWFREHDKLFEAAVILLILVAAILLRLSDLKDWKAQTDRTFFQESPLIRTFDGYYYLSLARDLVQDSYEPVNEKRLVPNPPRRPVPAPLLSVITAKIHSITSFSLEWIAVLLPVFLGSLLVIPLYFLGRSFGGPVLGGAAALLAVLSPYYFNRSSLGWFDTDLLNVTFTLAAACFFLRFALGKTGSRYLYFTGGIATWLLFLWWWNTTPAVVTVVSLAPLLIALIFFYRPPLKEGLCFFGILAALIAGLLFYKGTDYPLHIYQMINHSFDFITQKKTGPFPNISMTVDEQNFLPFSEIVNHTTNNTFLFLLSLPGLLLLIYRKPGQSLFLAVPAVLALLSLLFAKRFLIFLAPVTALGLACLIAEVWQLKGKWRKLRTGAPVLLILFLVPPLAGALPESHWPKVHPLVISGMDKANRETPEETVIWSWWDQGYPIQYWARRGTISDGGIYDGLAVYNAVPLATDDFRLSANFIYFYVNHGRKGIRTFSRAFGDDRGQGFAFLKEVLAAGPEQARDLIEKTGLKPRGRLRTVEDWLAFLFPAESRPVYLFLDPQLINTHHWWYWLGTWDIDKQKGSRGYYKAFSHIDINNKRAINGKGLKVNLVDGLAEIDGEFVPIRDVVLRGDGDKFKRHNFHEDGINFEVFLPVKYGVLTSPEVADSVFNKLYLRHISKKEYFRPVSLLTPAYQLWEVRGDTYIPRPNPSAL